MPNSNRCVYCGAIGDIVCHRCNSHRISVNRCRDAAPDLLQAAKNALRLLRGSGFTDSTPAIIALKGAIEKAEGKS